jgi:hypothetical protein
MLSLANGQFNTVRSGDDEGAARAPGRTFSPASAPSAWPAVGVRGDPARRSGGRGGPAFVCASGDEKAPRGGLALEAKLAGGGLKWSGAVQTKAHKEDAKIRLLTDLDVA